MGQSSTSAFSTGAAIGLSLASLGVCLGVQFAAYKWIQYGKWKISKRIPICVGNNSEEEILVRINNLDALLNSHIDDAVHNLRSMYGVGQMETKVGPQMFGEVNPPAEVDWFRRFMVTVSVVDSISRLGYPQYREVTCLEAGRADVLVYRDGALHRMPDQTQTVPAYNFRPSVGTWLRAPEDSSAPAETVNA